MGKASLLRFSCPVWNGLDVKLGVVAVLTEVYHTVYSAIWGQYGCKQCCFGAICLHTMLFWGSMPAYSTVLWQYAGLQCSFGAPYNAVLGQYACIQGCFVMLPAGQAQCSGSPVLNLVKRQTYRWLWCGCSLKSHLLLL